ncbi:MAG TPA: hypothetical protein PKA00_19480, partial [Saprospiraceae bacterium]|nr:hypothetical protein [Saprospiraceae bacterium]
AEADTLSGIGRGRGNLKPPTTNQAMRLILTTFCTLILISPLLIGQGYNSNLNEGNGLLFKFSYGYHVPGGDLADRFGSNSSIQTGLDYITDKSNWIIGLDANFYFGSVVKEAVLGGLLNPEGFIIGNDRDYADIQLRERGIHFDLHLGKIFPISPINQRSGIRVHVGAGLLQHKIRIQDDPIRGVPQLFGDYKKGYDRLTNGLSLTEFVGYQHLSRDRRLNFYGGFEWTQAFTQSRRDFNFDTMSKDEAKRFDSLIGFRIGLILPFYLGQDAGQIYY